MILDPQIQALIAESLQSAIENGYAEEIAGLSAEGVAVDLSEQDCDCETIDIETLTAAVVAWRIGLAAADWQPTPERINALPEPIRRYIHDLETRCDPAGDVAQIACLRETCGALSKRVAELEALALQGSPEQQKAEETRVDEARMQFIMTHVDQGHGLRKDARQDRDRVICSCGASYQVGRPELRRTEPGSTPTLRDLDRLVQTGSHPSREQEQEHEPGKWSEAEIADVKRKAEDRHARLGALGPEDDRQCTCEGLQSCDICDEE